MILPYNEIKESITNSYKSLHKLHNYSVKDTLYAIIGEYDCYDEYSKEDEMCIYLIYANILLSEDQDIKFMKKKLVEILNVNNLLLCKKEFSEDYEKIEKDFYKLKKISKL